MYAIDLFEMPGTPEVDPRPRAEYQPAGPHVPGSRNRALGNANIAMIMKSLDTPGNPPITLSFLNGTTRQLSSDEILDIADYYDTFQTKTERANFIYRTLVSQDKMSNLLAQLKQTEIDFSQPEPEPTTPEPEQLDLFKEDQKKSSKDDELTGRTAKDVTVARELQKLRARHPAAKTDIEALIKDEMVQSEKNDRAQDAQDEKIDQLEQQTTDLQATVQNMQAANNRLQDILVKMSGRKPKVEPGVSVATDKVPAPQPTPAPVVIATEPVGEPAPAPQPTAKPPVRKKAKKAKQPTTRVQRPSRPAVQAPQPIPIEKPEEEPIGTAQVGGEEVPVYRPSFKDADLPTGLGGGFRRPPQRRSSDRRPTMHEVHDIGSGQVGAIIEDDEQTLQDVLFRTAAKAMYDASQHGVDMDYETAIRTASKIMKIPYAPSMLPALNDQLAAVDKKIKTLKSVRRAQRAREQEKLTHQTSPDEQKRMQDFWKERGKQMVNRLKMREGNELDDAMKQKIADHYIKSLRDPNGRPMKALKYSFSKYATLRDQLANEYAKKFGIDPEYLHNAAALDLYHQMYPVKEGEESHSRAWEHGAADIYYGRPAKPQSHGYEKGTVEYEDYIKGYRYGQTVYGERGEFGKDYTEESSMAAARKHPTGPKFTGYWKGTDKGTPGTKMVGGSMEENTQPKDQDVLGQLFKDFEKIFGKQPAQPKPQPQKPVKEITDNKILRFRQDPEFVKQQDAITAQMDRAEKSGDQERYQMLKQKLQSLQKQFGFKI